MGLNTKHGKTRDRCNGYNKSQESWFKFELLNENTITRYEAMFGIQFDQAKTIIRINGRCTLAIKDTILIFGQTYQVMDIKSSYSNLNELANKDYLDDSLGESIVMLQ